MGGGTAPDADVDKGIGIGTDIDDKNLNDDNHNNVRDISSPSSPSSPSTPEHEQEQETNLEPTSSTTVPATTKQKNNETPLCRGCGGDLLRRIYDFITWTPPRCRWDPKNPPKFNLALNLLFGFAATFTVANLYYSHPILGVLADAFNVSDERSSIVPTVMQAGYAAGLLFLCPLGDLVRRRPFVLILAWFTSTVWLGLCLTTSFEAFVVLSFVTSVTTVTPQIMLPLVGDLAPPHRRATALSIVVSGLLLGLLIARLLSGIIASYSSWRNVYWMSFALQYAIVILLWLFMPDYPPTNTRSTDKHMSVRHYHRILWSIVELVVRTPVLVQSCLMGFFVAATFTSFWTTLTFLLSSEPYNYSTIVIGLFAIAGIVPMLFGPFFSRYITDRFVPLLSVFIGELIVLIAIIIGTYTGRYTVAGPIIQAILLDFGQQTSQIANRTTIYAVAPKARNRVNTAYMLSVFCGQLMGTAVGNKLYARGGWVRSGSASVGFVGAALVICFLRGPWETGWVGWRGGFELRRRKEQQQQEEEAGSSKDQPGQPGQQDETEGRRDADVDVDVEKGAGTGAREPQRLQSETNIPIDQRGHP